MRDGLTTEVAHRLLEQDCLLGWLQIFVNNAPGGPFVGHLVASRATAAGKSDPPDEPAPHRGFCFVLIMRST